LFISALVWPADGLLTLRFPSEVDRSESVVYLQTDVDDDKGQRILPVEFMSHFPTVPGAQTRRLF